MVERRNDSPVPAIRISYIWRPDIDRPSTMARMQFAAMEFAKALPKEFVSLCEIHCRFGAISKMGQHCELMLTLAGIPSRPKLEICIPLVVPHSKGLKKFIEDAKKRAMEEFVRKFESQRAELNGAQETILTALAS